MLLISGKGRQPGNIVSSGDKKERKKNRSTRIKPFLANGVSSLKTKSMSPLNLVFAIIVVQPKLPECLNWIVLLNRHINLNVRKKERKIDPKASFCKLLLANGENQILRLIYITLLAVPLH